MKFRVIDFETTGSEKDLAAGMPVEICEIGWTDLDDAGRVHQPVAHLVNPNMPMPPAGRGIHHISDGMLADAMTPSEAKALLLAGMEPGDLFCAHNSAFERLFFSGGAHAWICTMRCAQHLWEDAPDHKNQTLRYWLNLEEEFEWPELTMPAHRAGPDSYVTAHILGRLLLLKHPAGLAELSAKLPLLKKVPFGKYEGQLWSEMDEGYLQWCLDPSRKFTPEVIATAQHHLQRLRNIGQPF